MKAYGRCSPCLRWPKGGSKGFPPGFTLVELMVGVAILAILLTAAVPAVTNHLKRHAPQYAADELYGDIQLARLRAARIKQRCRIQFNAPGPNQYTIQDVDNAGNLIAPPIGFKKVVDLAKFRDNITFTNSPRAADTPPFQTIEFLSQGVLNTVPPNAVKPAGSNSIYLTNQANDVFFRVYVSLAGGSGVERFDPNANQWRTN